jgi:hypothetical protein
MWWCKEHPDANHFHQFSPSWQIPKVLVIMHAKSSPLPAAAAATTTTTTDEF